ncbi:hypothetical protein [Streptomyces scopuliridis]|uniref:Protein kilB n=1 Tax=Streptomyces scopuliridis RB72 TaxID=1440053 RepID=A0A2T7TDF8_9ACTN|nr:hypothetical protein [Streptomyces scopuliridis]PVE13141.1 hypothetical protein Y717_22005 [Streptomyces scopuliridis RB72]
MISTLIAVLGTLAGVVISGLFQHRAAGRTEAAARTAELRRERLAAVTELAGRISAHRRAMYMRGDARLRGESAERVEQLRAESHVTRSEVTEPLVRVRILVQDPAVRAAADFMVAATFGMRRADGTTDAALTREGLTAARETALDAHDAFVDVAGQYLSV